MGPGRFGSKIKDRRRVFKFPFCKSHSLSKPNPHSLSNPNPKCRVMDGCSASRKRKRKKESYQQRNQRRRRNRRVRKLDLFLRTTYESILPDEKYRKRSERLIKKVQNAITSKIEGSEVVVYGSQDYDVALSGSDVDFCVRMRDADFFEARTEDWMQKGREDISQISYILGDIGIRHRLKLFPVYVPDGMLDMYFAYGTDGKSGIGVCLSLNNPMPSFTSAFIKAVVNFDPVAKIFLTLIKYFAIVHDLNSKVDGLPNSGHMLLGIFVLQKNEVIPPFLRKEKITNLNELVEESKSYNTCPHNFRRSEATLSSLLVDFFKFYGQDFDYFRMALSIREGCLVTKRSVPVPHSHNMTILDPFSGHNVAGRVGVRGIGKVKDAFLKGLAIVSAGSEYEKLFQTFQ